MRTTKTTYSCDACKKAVAKGKDLKRYRAYRTRDSTDAQTSDLCGTCEPMFFDMLDEFGFNTSELREAIK